jgi:hypothetical protein
MLKLQLAVAALMIVAALLSHAATVVWLAWPSVSCGTNCTEIKQKEKN